MAQVADLETRFEPLDAEHQLARPGLREAVTAVAGRPAALRVALAVVLVGVLALAGLSRGHRDFSADQSLRITSPAPLATVSAPFTVSWRAPAGHRYAVFVDYTPISVGGSLHDLGSMQCKLIPTCQPSATSLESVGIYVSRTGHVQVTNLPILTNLGSHQKYPVHEITIIALDGAGRRIGTAAWQVEVHGVKSSE